MKQKHDSFVQRTAKNIFSGFMGGIANCLTGHPFDTLKVGSLIDFHIAPCLPVR